MRRQGRDWILVEMDLTRIGAQESGNQVEQRGLAAARWAEQSEEAAGRHLERTVVDRDHLAETLADAGKAHGHTPRSGRPDRTIARHPTPFRHPPTPRPG